MSSFVHVGMQKKGTSKDGAESYSFHFYCFLTFTGIRGQNLNILELIPLSLALNIAQ